MAPVLTKELYTNGTPEGVKIYRSCFKRYKGGAKKIEQRSSKRKTRYLLHLT